MAGRSNEQLVTGAHPTTQEFVERLAAWGFTQRREEGVHLVLRGPRGGTLRVLRSRLGRADPGLVEKAARLAGITLEEFWTGPPSSRPAPQRPATHDRVTSRVLAIHTTEDRPLGFDQVVDLCGGNLTRAQVRAASATLCRDGDLDRIRSGVYQWAGGTRRVVAQPAHRPRVKPPNQQWQTSPVERLFNQIFPAGLNTTAEILTDLQQWTELTQKLLANASHAASARASGGS